MNQHVSTIFQLKPEKWGLRGDSYLWVDIQNAFSTIALPSSDSNFMNLFNKYFEELTNESFATAPDYFYVEKYARGGMSSGHICRDFWEKSPYQF